MTAGTDRFLPSRINLYVPNMEYAADVDEAGNCKTYLGVPVAANATFLLSAQSIAATGNTSNIDQTLFTDANMSKFGRNIQVVASTTASSNVVITGKDYLGQTVQETITLNGTTPVLGNKAFKRVTNIAWTATAVTLNVGIGDKLGLPYRAVRMAGELVAGAVPTAGALTAGVLNSTAQTTTTGDPRGTYLPQASFLANGVRTFELSIQCDTSSLYGNAHFGG